MPDQILRCFVIAFHRCAILRLSLALIVAKLWNVCLNDL